MDLTESPDTSPRHYRLCVLGSGPSGQNVAVKMAKQGWSVVLVESRQLGGTCALRGCSPKKVLANASKLFDAVDHVRGKMTMDDAPRIDWSMIRDFRHEFTDPVPESTADKFRKTGIDWIIGQPKFRRDKTLVVGPHTISADQFVIATGAHPSPLPFPGSDLATTSDEFFDLPDMPPRVLFVGGGYVSMEFAAVARRCGSEVTVVQRSDEILPHFDADLCGQLRRYLADTGIDIQLNRRIHSIARQGDALSVQTEDTDGSDRREIVVDLVVHGAGRTASLDGLDLEVIGATVGKGGVEVDRFNRCVGTENVLAVGDCADTGLPRLTPTAAADGRRLVKNLMAWSQNQAPHPRPDRPVTAVAFTPVPIASVGLSESEAADQYPELRVNQRDTSTWGSVRKTGQTCAGYKVLIDGATDKIVGAHLLGPSADEQINLFTLAIEAELTATQLDEVLLGYPTFGSDVQRMV